MKIKLTLLALLLATLAPGADRLQPVGGTLGGAALLTWTNLPMTRTNFISGRRYTNTIGSAALLLATIHLTNPAVAGVAQMDLVVEGVRTQSVAQSSLATSLAVWSRRQVFEVVNTNEVYFFTNRSTGANSGATIVAGTGVVLAQ